MLARPDSNSSVICIFEDSETDRGGVTLLLESGVINLLLRSGVGCRHGFCPRGRPAPGTLAHVSSPGRKTFFTLGKNLRQDPLSATIGIRDGCPAWGSCSGYHPSKHIPGPGGTALWKLPQLWKSNKEAFGDFFLMISTSCLNYSELGIIQVIPSSRLCRVEWENESGVGSPWESYSE